MPSSTARRGIDARKTKDELIAELEHLRSRVQVDPQKLFPQSEIEEWFQESEPQLRLLTDSLPVLISYVDVELRYRYVNHAYEEWFGHARDWVIGRHVSEVLGEAAYDAIWRYLESALAGKAVTYEDTIPYRTGGARHTHTSFVPHFDESGSVLGFFASVTDISERKKAEEALREANERLETRVEERTAELRRANEELTAQIAERKRTEVELRESENLLKRILDEIPAALTVKDMRGRYLKTNKVWRNLFNMDEKYPLGKTVRQISSFTAEQAKEIAKTDLAVIEERKPGTQLVQHLLDRNGVEKIFDTRKVPLKDEEGNPIGLISIGLDITKSRKAELAILASGEKLRAVADNSPSTIILKDLEGRFLMVNRRFEEWHGVSAEEVIGKTMFDLFPQDFAESMAQQEKRILETGRMEMREYEMPTLKEARLSVLNIKFPVRDGDGKIIGVGAINTDITDRKKVENALSASETQFQELVEGSIQGVLIHRAGKPLFANQACADIFGYENPDAILHLEDIFIFVAPEDRQRVLSIFQDRKARKDVPSHYSFKGIKKDGAHVWIDNIARIVSWKGEPAIQATYFDITERVEAEEKLLESEELFRGFVENSPSGFYLKDLEGRYQMGNRKFEEWLGKSAGEFIGKTSHDLFPEEYAESFIEQDREVLETGGPVEWEVEAPRGDGVGRYLITKFPVYDAGGELSAIGAFFTDITERRQAEEALRSNQRLLQTVFETIPVGVQVKDRSGRYLMVNDKMASLFGQSPNKITGQRFEDLGVGTEEQKEEVAEGDHRVIESGETLDFSESPLLLPSGETIWRRRIKAPLKDSTGKVVGIVGVMEDITERKQAEKKLRESEQMLRSFLDNSPSTIFLKDLEGRYLMVNRFFEEERGKTAEELIGKTAKDIFPGEYATRFSSQESQVLKTGKRVEWEQDVPLADGSVIRVINHKFPVYNPDGSVIGVGTFATDITERKQSEKKLRESEELFRCTMDNSPIIFFLKDMEGRFLLTNPQFEKWMSKSKEEMIGKISSDLFPEAFSDLFVSQDREVIETGRPLSLELDAPNADGIRRIVCTKFPVRNAAGVQIAIGSIISDITERRKAESELRSSQRLLKTVFDTIPHSLYVRDIKSNFLMVNRAHAQRYNADPEDVIGMHVLDFPFGTAADRQMFLERDREVFESKERIENMEFSVTHPDGQLRHYRNIQMPLPDEEGKVVGVVGLAEDITDGRLAEINLRQSRDQLRMITDNLPAIILYIDSDERYLFINKTGEQWFDKTSDDLIGTTVRENIKEVEYSKIQPHIEQVLSGKEVRFESQINYADGNKRALDMTFIPDIEPDGKVKAYFALGRDITEFKTLEDKLRQSQKMEALGTLTGGIAHDFNNILAPILGFSEILMEKADPSTREFSHLNSIFKSAIRAKDLVSQIMLFSRPGESTKVNCDLRTVAREIVALLHSSFPKSISIQANISKDPGIVFCDPSQIYQVLLNLCVNAEKALGEAGEVTISLGSAVLDGIPDFMGNILSGNFVRLAVADNGIGMGPEILPHIFDPFFTRREVGEGTGLGLSTVFGIVKTHDGGIVVNSQPGQGSTFEIFLPRVEDSPEPLLDSQDTVPTGDETILFVDDEEEIVILAKETLENKGYRVIAFSDPIEALENFKANPGRFDLVLTDQSMPKMKGEWLVRDIRKFNTEIPIILCTGYSRTISPESGAAIGIDKFLYKPIRPNDLCRVVREVLDAAAR